MKIKQIKAREILDSRGNPALEARVILDNGIEAKAGVPSGASTGKNEALELRDGDESRYGGKGVLKACENVNTKIARVLAGMDVSNQKKIDDRLIKLDGTKNKKKLGANAMLGVSLACARAAAIANKIPLYKHLRTNYCELQNPPSSFPRKRESSQFFKVLDPRFREGDKLPTPMFNIFNGGKHADTNLDIQELMVVPLAGDSFFEKVRIGSEIFHKLAGVLKARGYDTDVGNEGGYAPKIRSTIEAIELVLEAIKRAGYEPGADRVGLASDIGASTFYNRKLKKYQFTLDQMSLDFEHLVELYHIWIEKYPFISLEDPLEEEDWRGWKKLMMEVGERILLVGDDLLVTNSRRLDKAVKTKAANACIVKPNQIGTLSETMEFAELAKKNNFKVIVSHRSGETCDDFIADLAVAVGADFVKFGAPSRGERVAKYNRLMEIALELKNLET